METTDLKQNIKLLIVEDDVNFAYIVRFGLKRLGNYEILVATNGQEGYELWKQEHPDIILADVEMPVMDGLDMVKKIRETDQEIPIVFTSSHTEPGDVVKGYRVGASNYVKKPCVPEELDCHLRTQIRLTAKLPLKSEGGDMILGKYRYHPSRAILETRNGNENIELTGNENSVLEILFKNKGEIVKKDFIMDFLWQDTGFYVSRRLDTLLNKLRKKLEEGDSSIQIVTVRSVGLRLTDE